MRNPLNAVIEDDGVPWAVYGEFSAFHLFTNPKEIIHKIRLAMLINGGDFTGWLGGTVSIAHTADDIAATAEAFARALRMLRQDGEI